MFDLNKDMTIKRLVTKDAVSLFPNCKGKPLLLMTSLSFTELNELVLQKKIDSRSLLYNIDNLSSTEPEFGKSKKATFSASWTRKATDIFRMGGMKPPKSKLLFKNIFALPLTVIADKPFHLVYADSCNKPTSDFFSWLQCSATCEGIADKGMLAFTVMLNRGKDECQFDESVGFPQDLSGFQFSASKYDGFENKMHYAIKMDAMKRRIESEGKWNVVRMIHYCEKDRKSQMLLAMCQKKK